MTSMPCNKMHPSAGMGSAYKIGPSHAKRCFAEIVPEIWRVTAVSGQPMDRDEVAGRSDTCKVNPHEEKAWLAAQR